MTVNTPENNYWSSLMAFKTKQDPQNISTYTVLSTAECSGNQQFMQISGTLLRQEERNLEYIFLPKRTI